MFLSAFYEINIMQLNIRGLKIILNNPHKLIRVI
jgi:hypothetical protein